MTSVLSTLNPLFEKNQTLTKSIYTSFNRSTREGVKKDSANSLVNTDETESLHYNNDNLVFDSTSGPSTVIISSEGNITTKGSINVDGVINGTCSNALHANTADSVTDIDPSLITQIENQVITKCDEKYMKNNITSLSLDELTVNDSTGTSTLKITTKTPTGTTEPNVLFMYSKRSSPQQIMIMNSDRICCTKPMALSSFDRGIEFNTMSNGEVNFTAIPQTALVSLVPSDINETQLSFLKNLSLLDKACPTYQYCENTYAKIGSGGGGGGGGGSDSDSSYKSITYDIDDISPYTSLTSGELDISSADELVLNKKDSSDNYIYLSTPTYDSNGGYTEAGIKGTIALLGRDGSGDFKNVKFRMTVYYKPGGNCVLLCKREFLVSDYVGTSNPDGGTGVVALFPIDMSIGLNTDYKNFYFLFSVCSADRSKTGTVRIMLSGCSKITTYISK